jgi:hypothetical protein
MTVTITGIRTGSEARLRRDLRAQIASLESELADANIRLRRPAPPSAEPAAPRLLSGTELESIRDELVVRVLDAKHELAKAEIRHREQRALLRRMESDPAGHRWTTVTTRDLGEPGCRQWQSRPILGVIGLLSGWWQVRVSSGCP